MKKIFVLFVLAISFSAAHAFIGNDKVINKNQLPAQAQSFLNQNFANAKISYAKLENDFVSFLSEKHENPLKCEYFLPFVIDDMIKKDGARVRVLKTEEKWYGVTYKEDAEEVKQAILDLTNKGVYHGI